MTFRFVCRITAIIGLMLFVVLLFAPGSYTVAYGVAADEGGAFLGRRVSPLFLGIAIVLWLLGDQTLTSVQRAICAAMVATFAGVAVTGLAAYFAGTASAAILVASTVELITALAFWSVRPRA